jgi:hypothetical protein
MSIIHKIAWRLKFTPKLKRFLKYIYQCIGNMLSDKKTLPSNIFMESEPTHEHLFGYYDKCPWSFDGSKMIYLRVKNAHMNVASMEQAEIVLKNVFQKTESVIASTHTWNVQQGCMLQWLGPDYSDRIIFNDYRNGRLCSVIHEINNGSETIISYPVYSVASSGKWAITLDFSRLHSLRPGYGYINTPDTTKGIKIPNLPCISYIDLQSGISKDLLFYDQLSSFFPRNTMIDAFHKVNHIIINNSSNRIMFLHRWLRNGVKFDRLMTCDIDGENMRVLLDEDMVSHCNWIGEKTIIAFAHTRQYGNHYYYIDDDENPNLRLIPGLPDVDGHPSVSPDGKYIVTDTYPNFKRKQSLYLYSTTSQKSMRIAEIYSSFKFLNDTRCDLHPRFNRDGDTICFDGAQSVLRQVYSITLGEQDLV